MPHRTLRLVESPPPTTGPPTTCPPPTGPPTTCSIPKDLGRASIPTVITDVIAKLEAVGYKFKGDEKETTWTWIAGFINHELPTTHYIVQELGDPTSSSGSSSSSDSFMPCNYTSIYDRASSRKGYYWPHSRFNIHDDTFIKFCLCIIRDYDHGIIHSFQEPIESTDQVRSFIDLDSDHHEITDSHIQIIAHDFIREYQRYHDQVPLEPLVQALRNRKNGHRKVHIYFPTLITTKDILKRIITTVKLNQPVLGRLIDPTCSGLRMIYSGKAADTESIYLPPTKDLPETLAWFYTTRIRAFNWEERQPLKEWIANELRASHAHRVHEETQIDPATRELMLSVVDMNTFDPIIKETSILLQRKQPSMCPICQRVHDSDNQVIYLSHGQIRLKCFRTDQTLTLQDYRPPTLEELAARTAYKLEKFKKRLQYVPPGFVTLEEYSEEHLRPLDINRSIQVIWSSMATGKTHRIIEFIRQHPNIRRVCLVSCRRSFAQSVEARFRAEMIPLVNYLEHNVSLVDRVIISAESLHKLSGVYDLIILDEVTSFNCQMNSGLHKSHLADNQRVYEHLITQARWIVAMDADIDHRAINFLHHLRPFDPIHLVHNTVQKRLGWTATELREDKMVDMMAQKLNDENKNIVIIVGSKGEGEFLVNEYIKNWLPPESYRFYHADGDDYLEEVRDVNTAWSRLRLLMYTSTISNGIDFTAHHFDTMFVFGSAGSNSVREVKQMMGRVRNLRDREVYFHLILNMPGYLQPGPSVSSKIRQHYINQLATNTETARRHLNDREYDILVGADQQFRWVLKDSIWTWLRFENEAEVNLSRDNYRSLFRITLENQGFHVNPTNNGDLSREVIARMAEFGAIKKEARKRLKREKAQALDVTPIISAETATELTQRKERAQSTAHDKLTLKKHEFLEMFPNEIRSQIPGDHIVKLEPHWKQLHNARKELDLTVHDIVLTELRSSAERPERTPHAADLECIRRICHLLGLPNTLDRTTVVTSTRIQQHLEEFKAMYPVLRETFKLKNKPPETWIKVIDLIDSVLTRWSACSLVKVDKRRQIRASRPNEVHSFHLRVAQHDITPIFDDYVRLLPPKSTPRPIPEQLPVNWFQSSVSTQT
jgi:late competence protein required for DNA uptake (superfamily II DNA/RNA helicase)